MPLPAGGGRGTWKASRSYSLPIFLARSPLPGQNPLTVPPSISWSPLCQAWYPPTNPVAAWSCPSVPRTSLLGHGLSPSICVANQVTVWTWDLLGTP